MRKMIATIAASTALFAAPALALEFDEWDQDENATLSMGEFTTGVEQAGWYDLVDRNEDNAIDQQEFNRGFFSVCDDDNNGRLSIAEWDECFDQWFGEQAVSYEWSQWNTDNNNYLSRDEFYAQFGKATDVFGTFAGEDEEITEDEFEAGLFSWFGREDEGVTEDEFADVTNFYD